jgi:hypothetical protein
MARWAAVAARGGGVAPPGSGDGSGSLWGPSGSKKMMGSFTAMSSSSSGLQLQRAVVNQWCTAVSRVWFLRIEIWGK